MHRSLRLTLLAVATILSAPGPASGAWQAEPIPGTAGASPPRSFAFDAEGRASIVFEAFDQRRSPARFTGSALRAPGGSWTRTADVAGIGWGAARAHTYGRTRALLITRQVTGRDAVAYATGGPASGGRYDLRLVRGGSGRLRHPLGPFNRARFRLVWALGRTDGGFGTYREIDRSADVPASAANAAGDALVAYTAQGAAGVRVSERAAGGRFGRSRLLGGSDSVSPAVAVNARGDRVVAWYRGDWIEARIRRAGEAWSAVARVARAPRGSRSIRALVTANGRAVLAWYAAEIRESRPARISASVAIHPRGAGWRSALLERSVLGSQGVPGEAGTIPVVDSRGELLVAWTGRWLQGTGVRVARISESARIEGPVLVSGEDQVATLDDAAAGPLGGVAVTYAEPLETSVRTWAALRAGTSAFAAAEALTAPGEIGLAGSRVAYSPRSGQPVVVRPLVRDGRGALVAAASTG
jgi:hypothetical protein